MQYVFPQSKPCLHLVSFLLANNTQISLSPSKILPRPITPASASSSFRAFLPCFYPRSFFPSSPRTNLSQHSCSRPPYPNVYPPPTGNPTRTFSTQTTILGRKFAISQKSTLARAPRRASPTFTSSSYYVSKYTPFGEDTRSFVPP